MDPAYKHYVASNKKKKIETPACITEKVDDIAERMNVSSKVVATAAAAKPVLEDSWSDIEYEDYVADYERSEYNGQVKSCGDDEKKKAAKPKRK